MVIGTGAGVDIGTERRAAAGAAGAGGSPIDQVATGSRLRILTKLRQRLKVKVQLNRAIPL